VLFRTPKLLACLAAGLALVLRLAAAEAQPWVELGATREEVISAHGQPAGESQMGTRHVLSYPQGQVTLENGRVVRVEPLSKGAKAPRKPPVPAAPVSPPVPGGGPDGPWLSDFESAAKVAVQRNVPILAVFRGPDDLAAGRVFLEEVALHPEFAATFADDYVLLRGDAPARTAQNERSWSRFGVSAFPAVLFLSAKGERLAAANFSRPPAQGKWRPEAIAALREIRARLALGATAPAPATRQAASAANTSPLDMDRLSPFSLRVGMRSAEATIAAATVVGLGIALLIGWLLWRTRAKSRPYQGRVLAARISEAASGIPTLPEMMAWSRDQVCVMAAVLAEAEGFETDRVADGGGKDLLLTRRGEIQPSVVVCCGTGREGTVTAKSVQALVATIAANRLQTAWYVSPAGFSNDARACAAQHKLLLIDGPHLIGRMHDLPPILIPKLQTSQPW
jgi:hypothetical protein